MELKNHIYIEAPHCINADSKPIASFWLGSDACAYAACSTANPEAVGGWGQLVVITPTAQGRVVRLVYARGVIISRDEFEGETA